MILLYKQKLVGTSAKLSDKRSGTRTVMMGYGLWESDTEQFAPIFAGRKGLADGALKQRCDEPVVELPTSCPIGSFRPLFSKPSRRWQGEDCDEVRSRIAGCGKSTEYQIARLRR